MPRHGKLDYAEFASRDLEGTKGFFGSVFGWKFVDYGPDYAAFSGEGLDGGFYRAEGIATARVGAPLLVLYSEGLEETLARVEAAGAVLVRPIFAFPGGRRFHFEEPGGNEFAVWSE